MKNLMLVALMVFGTAAMVNAQTPQEKTSETKEVKMDQTKKHNKKGAKKAVLVSETKKVETPKK